MKKEVFYAKSDLKKIKTLYKTIYLVNIETGEYEKYKTLNINTETKGKAIFNNLPKDFSTNKFIIFNTKGEVLRSRLDFFNNSIKEIKAQISGLEQDIEYIQEKKEEIISQQILSLNKIFIRVAGEEGLGIAIRKFNEEPYKSSVGKTKSELIKEFGLEKVEELFYEEEFIFEDEYEEDVFEKIINKL